MRRISILLLFVCLAATMSFGGGYQVGLHSIRNIGMGLIGTSLSNDASSLFYNPGGAPFVNEKWSFSGGISFVFARSTFQAKDVNYQATMKHELNLPFYFYAAYKPTKNLSVGLAVNTPYGNRLSWDDTWKGRYLIQNLSFKAMTFQPTISYKFKDIVGIGIGLVYAYGTVDLNKAIPLESASGDGTLHINGTTGHFGFNAGIMVHPVKGLSVGVDYRSKIEMKVKGATATFNVPQSLRAQFPENKVDVMLPLPANLDFGASYTFGKNNQWMVGINLCYVFWNTYDSLVFDFETKTSAVGRTANPAMYESRLIERIGVEYKINNMVAVRLGGYYDPSPVPTEYMNPQTPSVNETGITCGLSLYPTKGLCIDAAFLYLMGATKEGTYSPDNFAGTYRTGFNIPGIGLTYNF
ncbi:MAG: outer membrane protein transport protein [Bacteroidales bacterium]|nr:outer membrane protein transport protein [Bacteroidales bacterium]MDD4602620.1 outer membrane protein transport protein [Bacteroidales bacterium]